MADMTIKMIPISLLQSNKNNPREHIAPEDITELAASIKENGILQPLTAFLNPDGNTYTLTMGHRRLAAARTVGLTEIPCIISESKSDSESTLIAIQENGHRRNLKTTEEARAMAQLKLGGMDVETIAKRTGFCRETVRKKVAIGELNQDMLAEREAKVGEISIGDLEQLTKVTDPEAQARLAKVIGTKNFQYEVERETRMVKAKALKEEWLKLLPTFAQQIEESPDAQWRWYKYITEYSLPEPEVPADAAEGKKYVYRVDKNTIYIYREADPRSERDNICDQYEEMIEQAYSELEQVIDIEMTLTQEFTDGFGAYTKYKDQILQAVPMLVRYDSKTYESLCNSIMRNREDLNTEEAVGKFLDTADPMEVLFHATAGLMLNTRVINRYDAEITVSEKFKDAIRFLESVGYVPSDKGAELITETLPALTKVNELRQEKEKALAEYDARIKAAKEAEKEKADFNIR